MQNKLIVITTMLLALQQTNAQRPSYAGSRPSDGLNQKDKYHGTQNLDIANRIGGVETTTTILLPFGAEQRPPVGVPIVMPNPNYIPLGTETQQVAVNNRIGGTDDDVNATGSATTTQSVPLPLDAHGDLDLINQLNNFPEDKRPFWFINYQAIEAHRNGGGANIPGAAAQRGSFMG